MKLPFFRKKKKEDMPEGLWLKCGQCQKTIFRTTVEELLFVCPECAHHFPVTAPDRMKILLDPGSFEERFNNLESLDPLEFKGPKPYPEKIAEAQRETGLREGVVTGKGKIKGIPLAIAVTDFRFIGGSMGSVVGEKITRTIEMALAEELPLVIVSGSGGGARMYEGMLSLMQMAKTCSALARLDTAGLPYISVLTNPTMAGVLASFASLGDAIVAEPKALIGFTGPRVIRNTIQAELPRGFQTSEFLLDHGQIDRIIHRKDLRNEVANLLAYMLERKNPKARALVRADDEARRQAEEAQQTAQAALSAQSAATRSAEGDARDAREAKDRRRATRTQGKK